MGGGNRQPFFFENGLLRKMTVLEAFCLMGFSKKDNEKCISSGISNTQLYKQAGNSIVVNVLEKIFESLADQNKVFAEMINLTQEH
jgi:site-specific DNA-cytosine methylase